MSQVLGEMERRPMSWNMPTATRRDATAASTSIFSALAASTCATAASCLLSDLSWQSARSANPSAASPHLGELVVVARLLEELGGFLVLAGGREHAHEGARLRGVRERGWTGRIRRIGAGAGRDRPGRANSFARHHGGGPGRGAAGRDLTASFFRAFHEFVGLPGVVHRDGSAWESGRPTRVGLWRGDVRDLQPEESESGEWRVIK